jgi:alpha-glucoside transport system permease protein
MTTTTAPPQVKEAPPQTRRRPFAWITERWLVKLVVLAIAVIWLIPTLGLLITSFRPQELINTTGWWTSFAHIFDSSQWTISNYDAVLSRQGFGNSFLNSLAVTIPSTVIPITIAAFAAYAFAWMEFKGRQIMFVVVVGLLVVPLQMALIPVLRLYTSGGHIGTALLTIVLATAAVIAVVLALMRRVNPWTAAFLGILAMLALVVWLVWDTLTVFPDLDLNGTYLAVWLAHTGFGLPLAIYLLRNYIGSLPSSIIESARIDGADHFKIFTRLIVPLSVPVLASFAIFQFLWVWNDLLVALIFLGGEPQNRVITQALMELNSARGQEWQLLTAGAFISMVLPLGVFFSLQRFFVRGLTAGSVKG